jgi:hypothetical protein
MKLNEKIWNEIKAEHYLKEEAIDLFEKYEALISSEPCKCSSVAYSILKAKMKGEIYGALLAKHFPSLSTTKLLQLGILGILIKSSYLQIETDSLSGNCELCKKRTGEVMKIINYRPENILLCKDCGRKLNLVNGFYYLKVIIPRKIVEEVCSQVHSVLLEFLDSKEEIENLICIIGEREIFRKASDPIIGIWNGARFFLIKRLLIKECEFLADEILFGLAE